MNDPATGQREIGFDRVQLPDLGQMDSLIKLGARDRAQLVVFAYQAGLVTAVPPGDLPSSGAVLR